MSVPQNLTLALQECIRDEDEDDDGNDIISNRRATALYRILQVYIATNDDDLEREANDLETRKVHKLTTESSFKKTSGLSPYNEFMNDEIVRVKRMNPSLTHQQAFKVAAENWKAQKT